MRDIVLADRLHCTGCSACQQSCKHDAITMVRDAEGFLIPEINYNNCIQCGLCQKRCPEINPLQRLDYSGQDAYALISKTDRKVSSSGGAFSVFARWVIQQGGVVFGASIDDKFKVSHIAIERVEELYLLRGSKYVQSDLGNSYMKVKDFITNGRMVLFSGTGCQVAGLYAYLGGKRYEGLLYTLDLVCHGTPSQGMFDSYLEKLQKKLALTGENMKGFRFRKLDSWSIVPAVQLSESKERILALSENVFMDAFFDGLTFRESCYNCQYCNTQRIGTFTIADFWGIGRHGRKFNKNVSCGVSLVIDNTGLMDKLMPDLEQYAYIERRSMEEAVAEQTNLKHPMHRLKNRVTAVVDMMNEDISLVDYARKYGYPYKHNMKSIALELSKRIIYAFGLYNLYKTISYKLGK